MPGLSASLRAFEPDQLEQIALFWGVGVPAGSKSSMRLVLELSLVDNERFQIIFESLSDLAQSALLNLKAAGGQMNWSNFSHRYGEIRAMGPARRKKEQPWAFPVSISETLWYRGLIGRDFLREGGDLQDMAYLPDEFLAFLPDTLPHELTLASLSPHELELDTNTRESNVLSDVCTLLAALRFEQPEKQLAKTSREPGYWQLVGALLRSVSVLDANNEPSDLARLLLEMPRWQGLPWLQQQWLNTSGFNEFNFIPGLQIESDEPIDTRKARQNLVSFLSGQNLETWFSLDELMELMKQTDPDFLRQQEQYFSWTVVRQAQPEVPLAGLESWLDVEGAFIRFVVTQMLPLLGAAQSFEAETGKVWFRLQPQFFSNAASAAPGSAELEESSLIVSSAGKIVMTDRSPLILRYQVSRFCDWLSIETNEFTYQLSPTSLSLAREQGLLPKHLITLLRKNAQGGLPPALYEAIRRWESSGSQAKIENLLILRVASPEMLQTLRETAAGRWLGEALGPTAVILKPGGQGPVRQALAYLGYLSDYEESEIENV
jgi:hypothetical protein